ncbi:MAG: hypothetical protein DCF26_14440 [Burkholderiales bacterium]|nr:MAG: hypothetical protein DCF26_14440 [Burkholderiales bacterium]
MAAVMIMAFDAHGEIRFVGDVPKGAGCGCFCPTCKSPLVAKKGFENEWHFAHEASQERPECAVGAENLARSLGIEHLRHLHGRGALVLPPYTTQAGVATLWLSRSEPVTWAAQLVGPLTWRDAPGKAQPVVTGMLDTGAPMAFFVQVGGASSPSLEDLPDECAYATLLVSPSWPRGTRTRQEAMASLAQTAKFHWGYLPDTFGMRANAQREIEAMELQARTRAAEFERQRSFAAGRRWANIANAMNQKMATPPQAGHHDVLAPVHSGSAAAVAVVRGPAKADPEVRFPQYPGHSSGCNFQFFRLGPDEAWVFYELDPVFVRQHGMTPVADKPQKFWAIAPAHGHTDGWEESLPPSVGKGDIDAGIYWVRDLMSAVGFLSPRSKGTTSAHDPSEFQDK